MTVPSATSKTTYAGNDIATAFSTGFYFQQATDLRVTLTPSSGSPVVQTLGVHYSVTVPAQGSGLPGQVLMGLAPATGETLTIERDVDFVQDTSLRTIGTFSPSVHEDKFDRVVFMIQELDRRLAAVETATVPADLVAGNGLAFAGSTLNVGAGEGVVVDADDISIDLAHGTPGSVSAAAGAAGSTSQVSRGDHTHQVSVGSPSALTAGGAGGDGTADALARADHVHAIATAAPVNVTKAAAAQGGAGTFARSDHKHDVDTAAAVELTDTTNAEGNATTLARSNHTHAHGNRGGGSLHSLATSSTAGFMSAADKAAFDAVVASADYTKTINTAVAQLISTFTPADGSAESVEVVVTARKMSAADAAMYHREFLVTRNAGTTTLVGAVVTVAEVESNPAWDIQVAVASPAVTVKVVGSADSTIEWRCYLRRRVAP